MRQRAGGGTQVRYRVWTHADQVEIALWERDTNACLFEVLLNCNSQPAANRETVVEIDPRPEPELESAVTKVNEEGLGQGIAEHLRIRLCYSEE